MIRESFIFYSSFLQGLDTIQNDGERLKAYEYISHYSLIGEVPEPNDGIAYTVFLLIKPQIDANNKRYLDGCKGGRKPKEKTSGYENEKPVVSEKTKIKKPNDNENDNVNDNEKENNIILKNDTEILISEGYGNADINKLIDLVKKYNGGILDGTVKNNRRYGKLLIDKLNKLESIQQGRFTWYDTLEIILQVISENKFYASKITSVESIYRNLSVLMQQCKTDLGKKQVSNTILPVL